MSFKQQNINLDLMSGQRLMVGFEGTEFNNELKTVIKDIKVSGIILFAHNIQSANQVKNLCRSAQEYAESLDLPPLFIAVDQEGGKVARLRKPDFTEFQGNPYINNIESANNFASITAEELKAVNINMNLAPVMDFIPESKYEHGYSGNAAIESRDAQKTNKDIQKPNRDAQKPNRDAQKPNRDAQKPNSIMEDRAFKGSPEKVGELGTAVIETFQQNNIMAVAKHFPGIGRTTLDSHLELPILDADKELMEQSDFIPFKAAIKSDVSGIMLSHILYSKMDSQWQASLSYNIAKTLLRDEMGYKGVVMSDDLDMKAIKCDINTSIKQILSAEIDIALICHKGPNIEKAFTEIKNLISRNEILYQKGRESLQRITALKKKYI